MAKPNQIFERQSRVRMRSALRGAAFTGAFALLATWFGWFPKVAWGVVGVFLLVAAFEYATMRLSMRDDRE